MPPKRIPLRALLKDLYPEKTRDQLFAHILCGDVKVDGETLKAPAGMVDPGSEIVISPKRFVSRGGFKLSGALEAWKIDVSGLVLVDMGSSTGGFTDALLQSGATFVHAVDVGKNQLCYALRTDSRVKVHEETNLFEVKSLDPHPQAAVADLSFRSLRGAAKHILTLTSQKWMIALIKPQFELSELQKVNFEGVLKNEKLTAQVVFEVLEDLKDEGVFIHKLFPSTMRGRKGNQEYLAYLSTDFIEEPDCEYFRGLKRCLQAER